MDARFPGTDLTGTPSDVKLLQRIVEGGPYTDSTEGEFVALGTSLGDLLKRALELEWVRCTDEHGTDIGLRYRDTSIAIFPRDMLIKRMEAGEKVDVPHLYDGVIRKIQELVASGEYR